MKILVSLLVVFFIRLAAIDAQPPQVPEIYDFSTFASCKAYEPVIISYINWLYNHSIETEPEIRKRMHTFIHRWGKESPTLLLFPFTKVSNPVFKALKMDDLSDNLKRELFMSYYNGMVEHLINHPAEEQLENVFYAGVDKVLILADNNPEFNNLEVVTKYRQLKENESLDKWIKKKTTSRERKIFKDFGEINLSKSELNFEDFPFEL